MLFATHEFALFLLAVFLLCSTERLGAVGRKLVLLLASVFFYACWDLRFTGLLLFSVALNYAGGLLVGNAADPRARRR